MLSRVADELNITSTMQEKAVSSYEAVGKWIGDGLDYEVKIMPQGSMNLGTVVRPIDDYDMDLVCLLKNGQRLSLSEIKNLVGNRLKENEVYKKKIDIVNSERAVQFRKWINQIAKDYTIKGWAMDDERIKRDTYLTNKYFEEQLERIKEIMTSERKLYQKINDLYTIAIDYDKNSKTTKRFYATIQNKMHYAVHGHTAAEVIVERANSQKEHMVWQNAPEGKIKRSDVTVAKNYLTEFELSQLNRMVTSYLVFADNMALRKIPLTMQDWEKRLNSFTKEVREKLPEKTSQRKLADMLQMAGIDVDKNAVQRIENGKRFVTDIELKVIAEVLGVSYQELLDN